VVMSDDVPRTSGRYGDPPRPLARDEFATVLSTLGPLEGGIVPPAGYVPDEAMEGARWHCRALAAAYPGERLGQVTATVADALGAAGGPQAAGEHLLYAAALLCQEEAARTDTAEDSGFGSASWTRRCLLAVVWEQTRAGVQRALAGEHRAWSQQWGEAAGPEAVSGLRAP
jgi:hypothetical protein